VKNKIIKMKKIIFLAVVIFSNSVFCQAQSDASRIVLNAAILDKENKLPEEAKKQLIVKLNQVATENGVGGNALSARFVIAAKINVLSKDIVAGPPQMIAQNLEVVFFIGDATNNAIFSNTSLSLKGVGTNENKALISAIQNINPKNKQFIDFINTGKNKIIEYYSSQCDFINKKAVTLSSKQDYDAAIYELMQVPEVCKLCYEKCMDGVQPIFQKKIDADGIQALNEAKNKWSISPNKKGAEEASVLLSKIEPSSSSYKEAISLTESIGKKIEADEKRNWDFKMKKYADGVKLEQQRIEAARQTAIEYYKNQPQTIIYNNIIW
jgi:hypothetical protein